MRRLTTPTARVLAAVLTTALVLSLIGLVTFRSTVTPVTIDQATERFRTAQPDGPQPAVEASPPVAPAQEGEAAAPVELGHTEAPDSSIDPRPVEAGEDPVAAPAAAAPTDDIGTAAQTTAPAPDPTAPAPDPTPGPRVPDPGVYVYRTEGGEQTSLPGSSRTYPSRTTTTVRTAGCGVVLRWDVAEERWDEMELCVDRQDVLLARLASLRSLYRFSQQTELVCEEGSRTAPARLEPGAAFAARCASDDMLLVSSGTVTAFERLTVEGAQVETALLVAEWQISGATEGHRRERHWVEPRSGLVVRSEVEMEGAIRSGVGGTITYSERYVRHLESLTPHR